MSKLIGRLLVVLVFAWAGSANASLIQQGETFIFRFDTLDLAGSQSSNILMNIRLNYASSNIFGTSESMRLAFYEDDLTQTPFFSDFLVTSSLSAVQNSYQQFFENYWADLQGVVRLEMIIGSIELQDIQITVRTDGGGDYYSSTFEIADPLETDIPATIPLIGIALAALGLTRRKRQG